MVKELVSVVVPVYNVEKYLDRCISSIVGQTYTNLEIILVDDGSPDNCPQMCDEWAKRDGRIKVIHKENEGLGRARNTGLEQASGEYICFYDSDDFIEPETIERAYTVAVQNDADIVCYGLNVVNAQNVTIKIQIPDASQEVYCAEEVQNVFLPRLIGPDPRTGRDYRIPMSAWSKMFSMRCIQKNNWRFVSERVIMSEDYYSVAKLCADVEKVCILPMACYNYCQNDTSISRSYRKDRFERVCHFYSEIKKLCTELAYSQEVHYRFGTKYLSGVIAVLKQEVAFGESFATKWKAIREILNYEELQQVMLERKNDKVNTKKKVLFWAMRHKLVGVCYVLLLAQNSVS